MVTKQAFNVESDINLVCDGQLFTQLVGAGVRWLEQNHEHVNRLNVFPVPDGDTGTNMLLTMQEAYRQIATLDEDDVSVVARAMARGALNGARGNSGTILSQLWQGFADGLAGVSAFGAEDYAHAIRQAVDAAYRAVTNPTEGTILTVARESMEAVVERVQDDDERDLVAILKTMVFAARASLRHTPTLLPILKQAGVVDSGGQGFVYIFEGMLQHVAGKSFLLPQAEAEPQQVMNWEQALAPEDEEGYGYDVQFRLHGLNLDVEKIRRDIDDIGWSTVVVGNDELVKVHVHVHDPGKPLSYAIALGADIDDVVVENMQMQYQAYVQERSARANEPVDPSEIVVIAVAPGIGLRDLFLNELGAVRVVTGGQTMNPSTGDFLAAIRSLPHENIILLPNNKNIYLAAQQAAQLAEDRQVRVVPTRSVPQGISAMFAYAAIREETRDVDEAAAAMQAATEHVTTAEVTTATRNVEIGGVVVREGQLIGLIEGALAVSGDDMTALVQDLLHKALQDKHELVTLYYGSDTYRTRAQALADVLLALYPDLTFEVVYGGQSLYPYIISIE